MSEPGDHRLRTSDDEREQVAAQLRQAMGEGRLTLAEGEERLAAAYATTYRDELPPLTADLPPSGAPVGAGHRAGAAGAAGRAGAGRARAGAGADARTGAGAGDGASGWPGGRGRGPCRAGVPGGLAIAALVAAVVAGIVALSGGRPVWPVIVLGALGLVLLKTRRHPHHRG